MPPQRTMPLHLSSRLTKSPRRGRGGADALPPEWRRRRPVFIPGLFAVGWQRKGVGSTDTLSIPRHGGALSPVKGVPPWETFSAGSCHRDKTLVEFSTQPDQRLTRNSAESSDINTPTKTGASGGSAPEFSWRNRRSRPHWRKNASQTDMVPKLRRPVSTRVSVVSRLLATP
jgi:hypothetical protein